MKAIQYARRGNPLEVIEVVDLPDLSAGPGEVVIDVEVSPINPSDILSITGDYAIRPPLPAFAGSEGIGRISELGEGVDDFAVGTRVFLPLGSGTWRQQMTALADDLVPAPMGVDVLQMSMLSVNPPTAYLMIRDFVRLNPGDWMIQNAANSAVGRYAIQLAAAQGAKSINVVRRPELADELAALGAEAVIVDGDDLAARVKEIHGDAPLKVAFDAIGGDATLRLGDCLSRDGIVVNYGALSGEACRLSSAATIFRDVSLRGFWLARWYREAPIGERMTVMTEMAGRIATGDLITAVDSVHTLDDTESVRDTLARAMANGRNGKVLFTPNGAVSD